ncbi:MAG: ABC transporter permease subunit [Armatimonadetes bacterium]|nr:ABC transporter permease subunit [Armatimonadota bacterium]
MIARILLLALLLTLSAPAEESVVVGSKSFAESRILAEMMALMIESHTAIPVQRRLGLHGTMVCFNALRSGEIDVYPEYTGTGLVTILHRKPVRDPLQAYLEVQNGFRQEYGLVWLDPFGFNNSYALVMRRDRAEQLGISRLSQLKEHERELEVGLTHEFLRRADGYPGLEKTYGFGFRDLKGLEHGLAYEAVRSGKVDVIDAYTTDGKLLRFDLQVLEDDRHFFPPYQAAPVIRGQTLDRHPELRPLLNRLAFSLSDEKMQQLNDRVESEGHAFRDVAREFLRSQGLLGERPSAEKEATRQGDFLDLIAARPTYYLDLVVQHLELVLVSVLLATVLGVPLGIAITRRRLLANPVLSTAGVIQTIPSLALLAIMIPIQGLGLGWRSALLALFLYALLPIVRNTYTGIEEVDPGLVEAARGMGLKDRQVLWLVELPLATRTIMAGIRTSTVINVGVATLAAFIGAGGLGDPIITGLQLNDNNLILSGAVPAAVLAVLVDFLLGKLERRLAPRGSNPER